MLKLGWGCITSSKYEQTAKVLRQGVSDVPVEDDGEGNVQGSYVMEQDPITGQLIRVWTDQETPDDPNTENFDESRRVFTFKCQARGVMTGGLNTQGTAERWTTKGSYENVDFVEMHVPLEVILTKRDRITDITNSKGQYVWIEEEHGKMTPTVFDVKGVTPVLDPFGSQTEWFVLLERSEIQERSGVEGSG